MSPRIEKTGHPRSSISHTYQSYGESYFFPVVNGLVVAVVEHRDGDQRSTLDPSSRVNEFWLLYWRYRWICFYPELCNCRSLKCCILLLTLRTLVKLESILFPRIITRFVNPIYIPKNCDHHKHTTQINGKFCVSFPLTYLVQTLKTCRDQFDIITVTKYSKLAVH